MASSFKQFLNDDIINTRSLLHEQVPITGSIISGSSYANNNIRNGVNGYFQTVFDYPYASASSNQLLDIAFGYSPSSGFSSSANTENAKKIQMYNQMAQMLVGHDTTGSILEFDEDGDIAAGGTKLRECFFLCFSRLLVKDEIKKGTFSISVGQTDTYASANDVRLTLTDSGSQNSYRTNSPVGEYAILTSSVDGPFGLIFYQAGIVVLSGSAFTGSSNEWDVGGNSLNESITGSSLTGTVEGLRHRIYDLQFNNTTELNSSLYFVRIGHNEFNYSSNPTYTSGSKIVTKNNSTDMPVSYITTVGLYSPDNELMAVAKISEPLKKTPDREQVIRVRTDF